MSSRGKLATRRPRSRRTQRDDTIHRGSDLRRRPAHVRDTRNTIELHWSGIGFSLTGECTADGVRIVAINATPVDDTTSDIFASYWISDGGDYTARLDQAKRALPDDINIWEHQRYLDPPALAQSEADGFTQLRRWARAFYPG